MLINYIIMYTGNNIDFYIGIKQLIKLLPLIKRNIQKYSL
ncbi:protein of unknown function [Clostridium beijerinckii]|nr:protein of unknown function [Clostridium beijerinckii]